MICFAAALMSVLAAEPPPTDVYALVVGHNGGREGLAPLRFADDDALRMARTFSAFPGHRETWVLASPDDHRAGMSTITGERLRSRGRRAWSSARAK